MTNTDPGAPQYEYDWQNPNLATFDFGRVLGRSFTGMFANLKPLIIAVMIGVVITIILNIVSSKQLLSLLGDGSQEVVIGAVFSPNYWLWTLLAGIPALFLSLWVQLIVVQTSYADFTKTSQPSAPLQTALRFLLPMFVVSVIYVIACIIGFYLLLIGFVFLWPGWALAGPILVHEKKGIFGSIGRAWNLSRGSKGWIFLLLLVLGIIGSIIYFVMIVFSMTITSVNMFSGDPTTALKLSTGSQVINGILVGVPGYLLYALFASGLTAAYVEIKTMKGGVESVGEVFS